MGKSASMNETKPLPSSQPVTVSDLVAQIEKNTKVFLDHFSAQKLPEPTFENGDGLNLMQQFPEKVTSAREAAMEAAGELHLLLMGPLGLLLESAGDVSITP
jgi:hypothetical protein